MQRAGMGANWTRYGEQRSASPRHARAIPAPTLVVETPNPSGVIIAGQQSRQQRRSSDRKGGDSIWRRRVGGETSAARFKVGQDRILPKSISHQSVPHAFLAGRTTALHLNVLHLHVTFSTQHSSRAIVQTSRFLILPPQNVLLSPSCSVYTSTAVLLKRTQNAHQAEFRCYSYTKQANTASAREEKRRSRIQHRLMNKLQEERRAAVAERIQSVEPLGEDRLRLVEGTLEVCSGGWRGLYLVPSPIDVAMARMPLC